MMDERMGLLRQISSHTLLRESTDARTLQGLSLAVLRVQYLANQRFGIAYTIYRSIYSAVYVVRYI